MNTLWMPNGTYSLVDYDSEADLESAIVELEGFLFGLNRLYLPVKKVIGAKGKKQNIPDGYLIDLSGKVPKLYVVENERSTHEVLKHIAVQILEFSLALKAEPRRVRSVLLDGLAANESKRSRCANYCTTHGFRNLDHLLDELVHAPFSALVIIDRVPEDLVTVLSRSFAFGVEVLEVHRYQNQSGERAYLFEPFLKDVEADIQATSVGAGPTSTDLDLSELDTVIVPAHEDGFQETFLGENRWYQVRIHGTMRPQIKHIAAYRVAPLSAITHVAPVASIEPWEDSAKFVLNFSEPASEIGPITLVAKGRVKAPQNLRYTSLARLQAAKTLDDIW